MSKKCIYFLFLIIVVLTCIGARNNVPDYLQTHENNEPLVPSKPPIQRPDVCELKARLQMLGFYKGPLDEIYDDAAIEGVKAFQRSYWLEPSGVVDIITWKALSFGVERPIHPVSEQPPQGTISIHIDTEQAKLTVLIDGNPWKYYVVAVGKWTSMTPVGEWKIIEMGYDTGGAFGTRWMGLDVPWGGYGIHGTNRPWSIGTYASLGCVRMFNEDIEELFELVEPGTRVVISGYRPPVTFGEPLAMGTIGPEVVVLQETLRAVGFDPGPCDGRYGPNTAGSIRELNQIFGFSRKPSTSTDLFALLGL